MSNVIMTSYTQSALQTLLFASDSLEKTQSRSDSGLKIASAADNAGYWSVATGMRSDKSIVGSIADALNLGASKVDTSYEAVNSAIDILDQITALLETAYEAGTDRTTLNTSLTELKGNLQSVTQAATFSGDNWLYNTDASMIDTYTVPASFQRSVSGSVSLNFISISSSQSTLIDTQDASRGLFTGAIDADTLVDPDNPTGTPRNYYLLDVGSAAPATGTEISISEATTISELDDMIAVVSSMTDQLNRLGSSLGSMSNRIDQQVTYAASLSDTFDESISRLVDTDMEEESAKLAAFKTQQEVAMQVLSLLNSHQQSLSVLFS
ncbi:flagellin [Rhizobium sp. S95]|uniref:Flagellin n=1 Tax=Ciceribacter sichuanensis TaxID=2949647 RepID=A0AAJ1FA73_9HYPH|nr:MULTISPECIES: flagellin [unclassified Ciceribacter]MCM2396121.1 flagellin [Ciceribacter sp. S95]MCM2401066.1 flagellin [Ciceribacter sp. S153]MCO5959978.1 flagellin [Ciceribacter sp. S101]